MHVGINFIRGGSIGWLVILFLKQLSLEQQFMEFKQESFMGRRIRHKINSFLLNETNPPPLLYFAAFLYFHYPLESSRPYNFTLFLFSLVTALTANFNCVYMLAGFVQESLLLVVPMLAIGLLSCTERWKMYIFIFSVGDHCFVEDIPNSYFMAVFSLLICVETYRSLIFHNVSENIQYFVGMAVISLYYFLHILISSYQLPISQWMLALLLATAASFALALIEHRVAALRQKEPEQIYLERELAHFLRMAQGEVKEPFVSRMKVALHCRNCERIHCFCRNQDFRDRAEYLMRQLYENAIRRFDKKRDSLLIEHYIDFLLQNKQTINALHYLAQWKPDNYFDLLCHWRARARIDKLLSHQNSANIYEKEYAYALEYDQHSLAVAVEINKVLKLKLQFWKEINRENPRVVKLQSLGYEITSLMYGLNVFYNRVIKVYEQKIFVFDSTVLYAMYMLSTTNFKEYAELIIKNTAKLLEEVYVFENNASQTFAVRAVVKNEARSFTDTHKNNMQPISQPQMQEFKGNHRHKLIIDAVSNGLCKILHLSKSEILDNELEIVIPEGYRQVHNVRLNYLLDFECEVIGRILPSRILHRQIKLPIKAGKGQLLMGYVCIKYLLDMQKGLTFITIVKMIHDRSSNLLMDLSGNITEMQQGFNLEIVKHSEVKKYLNKLRSSWISEQRIREEKFNIMINAVNYLVTISSPFLELFTEKEEMRGKCPPIHIEVMNEQTVKNRNMEGDKNNKVGRQIKNMQSAIHNYDAQSSNNSTKGGTSAVSILTTFSENNTVPLYRFLYITFVAIITSCILSNIATYFASQLPWDNTQAKQNPLNDTMSLNALHMLTLKAMITLGDQQLYFSQEDVLDTVRISQYFGFANYEVSGVQFVSQLMYAYKSNIYHLLGSPSQLLKDKINEKLSTPILLVNTSDSTFPTQTVTYLQLLMTYTTDLALMTQLELTSTVIYDTYSPTIVDVQNCSSFSSLIDSGVTKAQTTSIAVHISLMAVMTILLVPLFYLLRKRLSLHEKIFDLLASIDPSEVSKEILSLESVSNILRNYKESNETMKMNVLDYEQNMIHPKRKEEHHRSSVDNDLVLGLEKYNANHTIEENDKESEEEIKTSKQSMESFKISMVKSKSSRRFRTSKTGSQIKEQFIHTRQEFAQSPRKRAGELDLSNSEFDPSRKIIPIHWVVYTISISFLIFLIISLCLNLTHNSTFLARKNDLLSIYKKQIIFEQYLLTIKTYLSQGGDAIQTIFGVTNELSIILPDLLAIPSYNYYDGDTYYSIINDNCTHGTLPNSSFTQKYCQFSYSEVLLRGEFGALFKELAELRYAIDHNLTVYVDRATTLINILEKFYYLQSLNLRLEQLVLDKINLLFQSITLLTQNYNSSKLLLLLLSVIWGLLCFLIGLVIMLSMKQGYFKQIFMITFLTNGMIIKNKRVESFLDSIAKNTSS